MKQFTQWSIRLQLFASLGTGAALIFSVFLYLNHQEAEKRIKTESKLHAKEAITSMVTGLVKNLEEVELSTTMLSVIAQHSNYSEPQLTNILKNIVVNNHYIYGASIAIEPKYSDDKNGYAPYFYRKQETPANGSKQSILFSDLAHQDYDYTQQIWYANAKVHGKASWTAPYFDDGGGHIYMSTFTVPIITEKGFYGVATGDIALQSINEKVQSVAISKNAYTLLLDHSLNIISGPDPKFLTKPLTEMLGNISEQQAWRDALQTIYEGNNGTANLPCPHQKGNCLVAYLPLLKTNSWPLLVIYPESEIYAEAIKFTAKYALVALLFIALLIIFIALLVKRLTQPLSLLTKTVESFGQGNLNVTLPNIQSNTETNTLALAFKGMQVSLTEYIGRLKTETANINRLEGELSAATQIQMEMLPGNGLAKLQFSSLSLWAHVIPAKSVGGDLYHYRINENKLTFIVGDVSDKGVPAALFMATTVSLFKQYSQQRKSPAKILTRLNDALEEHNDACMFVTACVGELNLGSGELIYSSAGHSPPLLKSELKLLELTQDTGPALGLVAGASYPTNNITMPAKSQLIIYTDGVDEAFNTQKEMYGLDRLLMHLNQLEVSSTQEIGESIFSSVATFSGEQDQSDDITVMVLEFKPAFRFLIHSASVSSEPMHLSVPAHTSSMPLILNAFDDYLKHQLDSAFDLGTAQLVIEEAFVNAVNHGKLSLNTVEFHFVVHEGHLLVEMIDSGTAFNPFEQCPEPELGLEIDEVEIGGLGVHLIKSMSLEHEYQRLRGKNHICLLISCEISI